MSYNDPSIQWPQQGQQQPPPAPQNPAIPSATYVYPTNFIPILPQDQNQMQNLYSQQYAAQTQAATRLGRSIPVEPWQIVVGFLFFVVVGVVAGVISLFS